MRSAVSVIVLVASISLTAAEPGSRDPDARELERALRLTRHGMSAIEKGSATRALSDFQKALAIVPSMPDAHLGLGHLAMRDRRFEDALSEYRLAEEGDRRLASKMLDLETERFVESRDELARLKEQLSEMDQASSLRDVRPAGSSSYLAGGSALRWEQIRVELDQRIQKLEAMAPPTLEPVHEVPGAILFYQGNALFNLQRFDEAIPLWETAARRDPGFSIVQNNLAVAYWKKGRTADARAALARAEALGFKPNPNFKADLQAAR